MRLRGALSVDRDRLLELKFSAFQEFLRGLLTVTNLNYPPVRQGLIQYLKSLDLRPNDHSLLAWLQENPGPVVGAFIFELDNGNVDFLLAAGTQEELTEIGQKHGQESNHTQRSPGIREVNLGERARIVQPRRI